jgi:cholesterol transport system auxiliary component
MRALLLGAMVVCSAGCPSFLPDSNPPKIRYFTVDPPAEPAPAPAPGLELRLARVDAASHIEDRIAFRDAGAEVGYYGNLRWSDPPEDYLRRTLARSLFEDRQLREIVSGVGPALEIELHAFEELKEPRHAARIAITWRLRDHRTVLVQRTISVERPIAGGGDAGVDAVAEQGAAAIAAAMAVALREVVDTVVAEVVDELSRERDATAAATP